MLRRHRGRILTWIMSLTLATTLLTLTPYAGLPDSQVPPASAADGVHDPNFPYFAAVTQDGAAIAKSGAFAAPWIDLMGGPNVKEVAITSDHVHGPSTALRFADGSVMAKTGGLSTNWFSVPGPVTQMAIASHPTGPAKLLTLRPNGDLYGRQGLDQPDSLIRRGVAQVAAAGDDQDGVTIVTLDLNGDVVATNDPQRGGWVKLMELGSPEGVQIDVASDPVNRQTVAVRDRNGVVWAKTGLHSTWVQIAANGPVKQVAVASDPTRGPSIVILRADGSVGARSGALEGSLVPLTGPRQASAIFARSDSSGELFVALLGADGAVIALVVPTTLQWQAFRSGVAAFSTTNPVVLPPTPTPTPTVTPTATSAPTGVPGAPAPTATAPTASSSAPGSAPQNGAPAPGFGAGAGQPAETGPTVSSAGGAATGSVPATSKIMLLKRPVVAGKRRPGKRLSVRTMDFVPADCKVRYRWLRDRRVIRKATSSSYRFTRQDVGKKLTVRITFTHPGLDPLVQIVMVHNGRKRRA